MKTWELGTLTKVRLILTLFCNAQQTFNTQLTWSFYKAELFVWARSRRVRGSWIRWLLMSCLCFEMWARSLSGDNSPHASPSVTPSTQFFKSSSTLENPEWKQTNPKTNPLTSPYHRKRATQYIHQIAWPWKFSSSIFDVIYSSYRSLFRAFLILKILFMMTA